MAQVRDGVRPGDVSLAVPSQVTLGKVLKAIVVMRSLLVDRTVVRGFNENVYNEDGKVSSHLWDR